ncbi:MAG: cobalamin-binding protein [Chromatiales bacterium]|nr:cobalamin-binding protein [Chromatiales bacterium]
MRLFISIVMLLSSLTVQAIEVVDDSGHTVTLEAPAQRIISLAPHITEQLFAIGAGERIVGAVEYSDYPEAAKQIPRIGGYTGFDLERILSLRPDLIVGMTGGNSAQQLEQLEKLGLILYRSEPRQLEDIASGMERLGVLTGTATEAGLEAERFRHGVERLRRGVEKRTPRTLFYQIWDRPLMTVNGTGLINEVLTLCGGRNVFAELSPPNPKISIEAVIAADPEVIIVSGMGQARPEWLDEWRRWPQLQAVKQGELHVVEPSIIQRATPRLLLGAEAICGAINSHK